MQYALIISETPEGFADRTNAQAGEYWGGWTAYSRAIVESGIFAGGAGLEPPETAARVVFDGASKTVQDGPYPDARERLGGFFLVEVDSLDDALAWAKRCPITKGGSVEVRPVLPTPPQAG
ncbi:YCII-related domain protein [Asticcacaulis biprosthecium C19]|uniref:YCII-related domain protein n=1 Tax=Asticcacaulis biprosthecium C19 TaxID=715226 RepID=F4QLI8_9CAUL|nr:YciI family protein [Asticcacaulis biprosthecium]EGF93486.1 YCII-related domain protein [Asticcacaulis biprosthecium C19]